MVAKKGVRCIGNDWCVALCRLDAACGHLNTAAVVPESGLNAPPTLRYRGLMGCFPASGYAGGL